MTLAEQIEAYTSPADDGCLAAVPAHAREAANDNDVTWRAVRGSQVPTDGRNPAVVFAELTGLPVNETMRAYCDEVVPATAINPATGQPWGIRPAINFDHLPRVIALSGAAGSGKSTVSDFLAVRFGYKKTKFAQPLKDMCRAIGMSEAMIEGDQKQEPQSLLGGQTPRHAMQTLGTEWGRDCMGDDFWVNLWHATAVAYDRVIVDDCRFANEAARVRRMGGRVIRLAGRGGIAGGHVSERADFIADEVIENTGTIAELQARVLDVIEGWRE